jgi:predicted transcriptional regulator
MSAAEWRVVQMIWDGSPIAAIEIVRRLETNWNHRTIWTMLNNQETAKPCPSFHEFLLPNGA